MQNEFDELFINTENLFYYTSCVNEELKNEVKKYVKDILDNIYKITKNYKKYTKEEFYNDYEKFRLNEDDKNVLLYYARRDLIYGTFMAYTSYLKDINPFLELEGIIFAIYDICYSFDIDYKKI